MALLSEYLPVLLFGVLGGAAADRFDRRRMVVVVNLGPGGRAGRAGRRRSSAATVEHRAWSWSPCSCSAPRRRSPTRPAARSLPGLVAARGPGHRQRPDAGRVPADEPAGRAADRRVPVRDRAWRCRSRRTPSASRSAPCSSRASSTSDARRGATGRARACAAEMLEGIRWLLAHPPMRTLALTIFTFNITFGAAWSVLVLYAGQRLGMDAVGFGLLTTAVAVGGVDRDAARTGGSSGGSAWPTSCASACSSRRSPTSSLALTTSARGRAGDAGRLRRPRVRVGHDVDRRPPARRARRAARPGRAASTASRSWAAS